MYKGEATIRVTRIHSSQTLQRPVSIEITDVISGDVIAQLYLSDAEFGHALSSPSEISCEVKVYTEAQLGMTYETKREFIPWKPGRGTPEERRKAAEPFEVNGWQARLGDFENHHNWGADRCWVGFTRYFPANETETKQVDTNG